ncbi:MULTISPECIES: hypothetical protein [Bradyrhizobium]|uniref:hypothetical protein n=1 Tax=Bradyrhizobium TaxID=374 RepID=UPI00293F2502|nr:hypothetical protein [Bradyrhizobium sp. NDS-1]WOH74828.1 hypothetical protein RX330_06810 [Bradyrhizobium sp. NDS-1]
MDQGGNMMDEAWGALVARHSTVIARLDRAIQYSATAVIEPRGCSVLDAPVKAGA